VKIAQPTLLSLSGRPGISSFKRLSQVLKMASDLTPVSVGSRYWRHTVYFISRNSSLFCLPSSDGSRLAVMVKVPESMLDNPR
jgi:hypothetical protein